MDLLTVEMKTMLAKKLLFTLNFRLMTNDDFFRIFDLRVVDIIDSEVVRFDLVFKEEQEVYISFKRISNGDVVLTYQLVSSLNGAMNKFEIYIDSSGIYNEYFGMVNELFEIVTDIEREEQFKKMDSSINRIMKHK